MENFQESLCRDPGALVLAEQLNKAGIAFHYVGNLCFEVRSKLKADEAHALFVTLRPNRSIMSYRMGDGKESKYFVEVCL